MTLVAIFTVMALSFGAIAWPFLGRRVNGDAARKPIAPWDDLVSQRDTTYQALKELEFEYNLGNLSDADYADLRERYRTQAAGVLQKLDTATADVGPEEAPPAVLAGSPEMACPSCHEAIVEGDTYCARCGERLGAHCRDCGEPVLEKDRFCPACGQRLEVEE